VESEVIALAAAVAWHVHCADWTKTKTGEWTQVRMTTIGQGERSTSQFDDTPIGRGALIINGADLWTVVDQKCGKK
jgi:hypothetical protein